MRILIATEATQGERANDFCWVPADEPVMLGKPCNRDKDHVDGPCGCARSFKGVYCRKATTTAKVADLPGADEDYLEMCYRSIQQAGLDQMYGEDNAKEWGAEWASRVLDFCRELDPGTIVELRHEGMVVRAATVPGGKE